MTKILFAGILSLLAVNVFAGECENLVKKIYECGERSEYTTQTICDSGEYFSEVRENVIDDLAVDTVLHNESSLRCDFSYPTSYTERCYGEVSKSDSIVNLHSYKCFDLETGKKIY